MREASPHALGIVAPAAARAINTHRNEVDALLLALLGRVEVGSFRIRVGIDGGRRVGGGASKHASSEPTGDSEVEHRGSADPQARDVDIGRASGVGA